MRQKDIFKKARKYAFNDADNINTCCIYPTQDALFGLNNFYGLAQKKTFSALPGPLSLQEKWQSKNSLEITIFDKISHGNGNEEISSLPTD